MATFQVAYNPTTKVATIQTDGAATIAGSTDIGSFVDDDPSMPGEDADGLLLFHHVRDLLYPEGELDMQSVTIVYNKLTGISVSPTTAARNVGQTQQLTVTYTPANASHREIIWTTSDPTRATVNATGLVTAVGAGAVTITGTSRERGFTVSCVVTVT